MKPQRKRPQRKRIAVVPIGPVRVREDLTSDDMGRVFQELGEDVRAVRSRVRMDAYRCGACRSPWCATEGAFQSRPWCPFCGSRDVTRPGDRLEPVVRADYDARMPSTQPDHTRAERSE